MKWKYFYDNFWEWSDSKILRAVPTLSEIEDLDFLNVVMNLKTKATKTALTKRAIKLESYFTHHEFLYLSTVLDYEDLLELADYAGFCAKYPQFRPTQASWDDFKMAAPFLGRRAFRDAIYNVESFGSSAEVTALYSATKDVELRRDLYDEAVKRGIQFSADEMRRIKKNAPPPREDIFSELGEQANQLADQINKLVDDVEKQKRSGKSFTVPSKNKPSFSLFDLIGVFAETSRDNKKHAHSGKCNGDCANCPPHYGYRYGRWYYGKHHTEGCEFGGNSNSGGID